MAQGILSHPYRVFRYKVEIDSITSGAFSEISGLSQSVDVVEFRYGNTSRTTPRKFPGLTKYGNVVLRRGVLGGLDTLSWILSVASNGTSGPTGIQRKKVTITLVDDAGKDGPKWELIDAWPVSYEVSDLDATSSEVAFETLEIAHEGLTRFPPPNENTAKKNVGSILSY